MRPRGGRGVRKRDRAAEWHRRARELGHEADGDDHRGARAVDGAAPRRCPQTPGRGRPGGPGQSDRTSIATGPVVHPCTHRVVTAGADVDIGAGAEYVGATPVDGSDGTDRRDAGDRRDTGTRDPVTDQ
jgi:hypothetical protein